MNNEEIKIKKIVQLAWNSLTLKGQDYPLDTMSTEGGSCGVAVRGGGEAHGADDAVEEEAAEASRLPTLVSRHPNPLSNLD